jgi:hypothetical protein
MRTMLIAATLGIFGVVSLTPAAASPATGPDELAQINLAQYHQEAVGPWSTASTTKKKKPKKKQRYERSN